MTATKSLRLVVGLIGLLVAPFSQAASPAVRGPNVMILLADDLGFSDLGCYGGEIETPRLDQLASGGLRFTQFYNTSRCWPTRSCLMTGYYAQQVGMDPATGQFPAWVRLLPQILRESGYRSYHSGKWHVLNAPDPARDGGFDETGGKEMSPDHGSDSIAGHAVKCLKAHAAEHPGVPFFSYVCFTAPHFPLIARPEDVAKYRERYREGWDVARARRLEKLKALGIAGGELPPLEPGVKAPGFKDEFLAKYGPGEIPRAAAWEELTEAQKDFQARKMAIHAASVERMDREIGQILDQLAAMGALEDTAIFFLSDNGASAEIMIRAWGHDPSAEPGSQQTYLCLGPGWSSCANTPFRLHKMWANEGGVSTPLIVHWPKGVAGRGELRRDVGHCVDLAPTILEMIGAQPPETGGPRFPGRSLVPAFGRDGAVSRDYVFFKHSGNQGLRVGDWKIVGKKDAWALYDLANDRAEQRDLAAAQPERLATMAAQWRKLDGEFAAQGAAPGGGGKPARPRGGGD